MNRREFLQVAGGAAAILPLAAFLAGCGGGGGSTAAGLAPGDFVVTSSSVGSHTHDITVKAADLTAGADKTYTTSTNGSIPHFHTVTIHVKEFNDINAGSIDNIGTNPDGTGHSHEFPMKKP